MAKNYTLNSSGTIAVAAGAAHNPFNARKVNLPDSTLDNLACVSPGGMQNTMRNGGVMLCQMPDGQLKWYRYDAERSTPSNPVVIAV